jgi:hypothetical protein
MEEDDTELEEGEAKEPCDPDKDFSYIVCMTYNGFLSRRSSFFLFFLFFSFVFSFGGTFVSMMNFFDLIITPGSQLQSSSLL